MAEWSNDITKKIRDLEEENEKLSYRLSKSAKHLLRLRLEKKFLLEKLDEVQHQQPAAGPSASGQQPELQANTGVART